MPRLTIQQIQNKKSDGEKIVVLTAYDYPMARLIDEAGVDVVLVGDSLANVVLGLESTNDVGLWEMVHHAKAVNRGVTNALVIGDMPYESVHSGPVKAIEAADEFIKAGCNAVKVEWFDGCLEILEALRAKDVAVMGHVGLTPQTADELGGFKVQGKDEDSAKRIIEQAHIMQEKGCFSIVLECIPEEISAIITSQLNIPTIGIGAGIACDGQVLVSNDLFGLVSKHRPKFVKTYMDMELTVQKAVQDYCREVRNSTFPDADHSYHANHEVVSRITLDNQ